MTVVTGCAHLRSLAQALTWGLRVGLLAVCGMAQAAAAPASVKCTGTAVDEQGAAVVGASAIACEFDQRSV